jgi:hypothetical protein
METASFVSMLAFEGFSWEAMWSVLYAVLPIWLFGAIVGLLVREQQDTGPCPWGRREH